MSQKKPLVQTLELALRLIDLMRQAGRRQREQLRSLRKKVAAVQAELIELKGRRPVWIDTERLVELHRQKEAVLIHIIAKMQKLLEHPAPNVAAELVVVAQEAAEFRVAFEAERQAGKLCREELDEAKKALAVEKKRFQDQQRTRQSLDWHLEQVAKIHKEVFDNFRKAVNDRNVAQWRLRNMKSEQIVQDEQFKKKLFDLLGSVPGLENSTLDRLQDDLGIYDHETE